MKRLIAAGIILAFIISAGTIGTKTVCRYAEKFENSIKQIMADPKNSTKKAEEFINYWDSAEKVLAVFVNHEVLSVVGEKAVALRAASGTDPETEFYIICEEMLYTINEIKREQQLHWYLLT